ncbi:MAG: hypothetical protein M5U01_40805 [Ardenticatenaceae bacterium]|nr:hypothetical protein [Ardenticatenaceae bacterium]
MIRILNVEPLNYSDEARFILQSLGQLDERYLTKAELLTCLPDYDVLIVRLGFQLDRTIIDSGLRLKAIVTATTGLDHIDVTYAEQRGIKVLSLRGETEFLYSIPATAEHTWALLLAMVRRIPQAYASVIAGAWDRDAFRGHDLRGKRLGIVGLGRIGEKVACYGLAFGMIVAAYDPYRSDWPTGVKQCLTLPELLERSDVLSLHVPLNAETERLIGRRELARLPAGAWLINTSRGGVLDEAALVDALQGGRLSGAALDVIGGEHQSLLRPLLEYARQHDNLLITPHIGGATVESMAQTEIYMARKLHQFLAGLNLAQSDGHKGHRG